MPQWTKVKIGSATTALAASNLLFERFVAFALAKGGQPGSAAVFSDYDIHSDTTTWYFTPEAESLAAAYPAAQKCEMPQWGQHMALLVGDQRVLLELFPRRSRES